MADKLYGQHASGRTLYAQFWTATGTVWNGASFEAYVAGRWAFYDVALTEYGSSGLYSVTIPTMAAATYITVLFEQAGGAVAEGDPTVGAATMAWDGSAIVDTSDIITHGDTNWSTIAAATVAAAVLTNPAQPIATTALGYVTAENTAGIATAVWAAAGRDLSTTPPTAVQNRVEMDSNSTQLAAIVADTAELQTDDYPTLIGAVQTNLNTITGADGVKLATAQALYAPAKAGDAMDLVADAVDAAAVKADAVTEIQAGLATAANQTTILANIAALNDLASADIATAVQGAAIDGAQTIQTALKIILAVLHGKADRTGTDPIVLTYKADDDVTTVATLSFVAAGTGRTNS
jgi:hypothetical protein